MVPAIFHHSSLGKWERIFPYRSLGQNRIPSPHLSDRCGEVCSFFGILLENDPSHTGYRQSDPTEAAATTRTYGNNRNRPGARPQSPHKHSQPIGSRRNTQKGPRGEGRPPPGRKTSLAKRVGGERGRRMEKSRPDRKEKRRREP